MNIRINSLGGKQILYDRSAPNHYGRTGVVTNPYIDETFAAECEDCFTELHALLAQHANIDVESVLTGGVGRAGTGNSYHHRNRAFDLDGLIYDGGTWVADTFPERPQLYLGIEAILRKHFGTVLSYDYNKAHEDHFHFDNGSNTGFKRHAKSHVIFIQNAIHYVYHLAIGRDGLWGPETERSLQTVLDRLDIGTITNKDNWNDLLDEIAKQAMILDAGLDDDDSVENNENIVIVQGGCRYPG